MNNINFPQNGGGGAMGAAAGQPPNAPNQIQQFVTRNLQVQAQQNPPQGWQAQLPLGIRYNQIYQLYVRPFCKDDHRRLTESLGQVT